IEPRTRQPPRDRGDLGERIAEHGKHAAPANPRREIDDATEEISGARGGQPYDIAQRLERPGSLPAKDVNRFAGDGGAVEEPDHLARDVSALRSGRNNPPTNAPQGSASPRLAPRHEKRLGSIERIGLDAQIQLSPASGRHENLAPPFHA